MNSDPYFLDVFIMRREEGLVGENLQPLNSRMLGKERLPRPGSLFLGSGRGHLDARERERATLLLSPGRWGADGRRQRAERAGRCGRQTVGLSLFAQRQ